MNLAEGKGKIRLDVKKANIGGIPLLRLAGIQGTGTISGRVTMIGNSGHIEFVTRDSRLEPAIFSGVTVPLNFFQNIRGSMDIKGDTLNIVSVAFEGKDIHARLKGVIKDSFMDLQYGINAGGIFY